MAQLQQPSIAVILPVYKDIEVTRECIRRCLPNIIDQSGTLILVNDASPEADMGAMLGEWASDYPQTVTVITNSENKGFVASANIGLTEATGHDIVLLNSDVFTPQKWLQVLRREAARDERIGTVTPLSNNSTITSLPNNNGSCSQLLSQDVEDINSTFDGDLPLVKAPTGIGFCMLITARCLESVGMLDVDSFSRGYGEESDFCQRAIKAGFLNALTPNLYCHHIGGVSFGESSQARLAQAYNKIAELHPNYHADVTTWVQQDPLSSARLVRTLQILKQRRLPFVLHLIHSIGGGPLRYLSSLITETEVNAVHIVLNGRTQKDDDLKLTVSVAGLGVRQEHQIKSDQDALRLVCSLGIDCIHIHHLAGTPKIIVDWVQDNGIPYIITYHDYYLINANPFLADAGGEYDGIYASPSHSLYRNVSGHPFSYQNWTAESQELIRSSKCNIFPSHTAYKHYSEAFEELPNARIIPHDNIAAPSSDPNFSIVSLGALGLEKGAEFLEKVAEAASRNRRNRLSFKIIGFAYRELQHVEQTGPYEDCNLQSLIRAHDPACIFFGNRCPETYSYTLSEAIESGLPIIAPMLGVFEERLCLTKGHFLYAPEVRPGHLAKQIQRFLESFYAIRIRPQKPEINEFYKSRYIDMIKGLTMRAGALDPQGILDSTTGELSHCYFI